MSEILQLQSVSRHFSGLQALCDVSLSVNRGEVLGLIGPNGAGKTTLVNVVTGVTPASSGTVTFMGQDITRGKTYQSARAGLSRTFQIVQPFAEFTALDNVAASALFSQPGESLKSVREEARAHLAFVGLEAQCGPLVATLTVAMRERLHHRDDRAFDESRPECLHADRRIAQRTIDCRRIAARRDQESCGRLSLSRPAICAAEQRPWLIYPFSNCRIW